MWVLTECCPALAPPQKKQKAQSDCGGAAVGPRAEQPRTALCRCPPGCVLPTRRWAEGGKERREDIEKVKRGNTPLAERRKLWRKNFAIIIIYSMIIGWMSYKKENYTTLVIWCCLNLEMYICVISYYLSHHLSIYCNLSRFLTFTSGDLSSRLQSWV